MADEAAVEVISALVPATLRALNAIEFASRHLSPATLPQVIEALAKRTDDLGPALAASRALDWPGRLAPVRHHLERAAEQAQETLAGLMAAPDAPQPIVAAYRTLRGYPRACEALYPLTPFLKPVSHFFLEQAARGDTELQARLAAADPAREGVGFMHIAGPAGTRGAFSLYVPEYYDAAKSWPLVVALHGGSGNGGAFLWSWVREARTRGFIVLAPTASGSTWSLMEPEIDGPRIDRMAADVANDWNIDTGRQLLTGMSDGGTFTYVVGLRGDCRFTHLAPVAASFHPMLMTFADAERLRGLPIHIVHGTQDWMFPPEMAQGARRALEQAGADVTHREIADLSHTYPRDENARILDWFLSPSSS
ncbi:phospholipase [uncultured Reyranella sp.]|uniref:carboxylesterase family protein n=1 Tax=uncultured Reyranella sp. TaxID=735512 RepID=UPI00259CFF22|nr:phospholipase [uncultured Reyranella sp.]